VVWTWWRQSRVATRAQGPGARGRRPAVRLVLQRDSVHAGDDPEPVDLEIGERTSAADVVRWTAGQGLLPGGGVWVLHLVGSVAGGSTRAMVVLDRRVRRSGAPEPWMATALHDQVLTPLRQLVWLGVDDRGLVAAQWRHSRYGTRVPALTFPTGAVRP
jgi:hypothetical protein